MSDGEHDWLGDEAIGVLMAAIERDADTIARGLVRIGTAGSAAMYGSCVAWAEAVTLLAGWRDVIGQNAEEGMVAIERLPGASKDESDPSLWAVRFVAATANQDHDTTSALFVASATVSAEHHGRCVVALVALAGDVGRHKLTEEKKGRPGRNGRRDKKRRPRR